VAAALAMRDARLDLDAEDHSRIAVVCGTGFGCLELTEACMRSIADNACGKSDPVAFPETLGNAPASHVARTFGIRGPNITVSSKAISGETAVLVARSLLAGGEADIVLVMSGDTLARTVYEWFEAASVLSSACFLDKPVCAPFSAECDGFVPGEGLAAVVLERDRRSIERGARIYASVPSAALGRDTSATSTSWGTDSQPMMDVAAKALGGADCPAFVAACANGSPALDRMEAEAIRGLGRSPDSVFAPKTLIGEFEGNALLRIVLALSHPAASGGVLVLGAAAGGDRAAITLEIA
jgi:3-oxoacyl-(acyl-carrier-protein) synthase